MRINNPFSQEQEKLINIESVVKSPEFVNVDTAENVENEIIKKMISLPISQFIPRKKDHCILMTATKNLGRNKKNITIDPILLFQRLALVLTSKKEDCYFM